MNAFGLAPLLLVFPFVGFLFNALVGRRFVETNPKVGEKWSGWIASGLALSTLLTLVVIPAAYLVVPSRVGEED